MDEPLTNEEIVAEARERFKSCQDWEDSFRSNYEFDKRFDAGDSTNLFQWPDNLYQDRNKRNKPCLTVNKVHQLVLHETNRAKQNPVGIVVRPVGNGATYKAAEILEGIIRHIEYISNATDAYDTATKSQVIGGIGFWRVMTDYADESSFDQEIFVRRISNAMSVYLDHDIIEFDGSDARFGFVFKDEPKDSFDKQYPKFKDKLLNTTPLGDDMNQQNWFAKADGKHIRVVEYYRRTEKNDKLHLLDNGLTVYESEVKDRKLMDELDAATVQSRDVIRHEVEWFLIAGDEIITRQKWAGKFIPLVRVVGEETVIDGIMDRKGIVRSCIDSQRMYNVMNSAAVEHVGMQTKVPWLVAAEAIESNEQMWATANTENHAYLVYNALNEAGEQTIPIPQRTEPPQYAPAYQQALMQAAQDMMASSGVYQAELGQESNERSGKAINARVSYGSNATSHFPHNLGIAIRFTGKIILDLIPKIYDTQRVLKVLGQDGTEQTVGIDPSQPQAHQEVDGLDYESFSPQAVALAINPAVGLYDVEADTGPSYGTKRQETFNAISQVLQENPQLTTIIGDLFFRSSDFYLADEMAERLKNMVPSQALGQGPSPELQQAQMHLANQHQVIDALQKEVDALKSKTLVSEQQKEINVYDSETKRIEAVIKGDPQLAKLVLRGMSSLGLGSDVNPLIHESELSAAVTAQAVAKTNPEPDTGSQ
jgi:portal protein